MPKFADLVKRGIPLTIDLHDDLPFVVEYSLAACTMAVFDSMDEVLEAAPDAAARVALYADRLAGVLTGWDFTDADGPMTPITPATLTELGEIRLAHIWARLVSNIYPNSKKPETSN